MEVQPTYLCAQCRIRFWDSSQAASKYHISGRRSIHEIHLGSDSGCGLCRIIWGIHEAGEYIHFRGKDRVTTILKWDGNSSFRQLYIGGIRFDLFPINSTCERIIDQMIVIDAFNQSFLLALHWSSCQRIALHSSRGHILHSLSEPVLKSILGVDRCLKL